MKKINVLFILVLFLFAGVSGNAQKLKLVSGKLSFLKGQKELLVKYDYSDMTVGKFDNEQDYVDKKVSDYNEKEDGRGDSWAQSWKTDREYRYQPRFEELMNKHLAKIGMSVCESCDDAKYTLLLKTTNTVPGWNVGITRSNAYISGKAIFVETANPDNVLAIVSFRKSPGKVAMGYDFDTGTRIAESYAKCGKTLAGFIVKKAK